MTNSDLAHLEEGSVRYPVSSEVKRRQLIAISARVGVWGIIGGLTSIIVGAGAPGVAFGLAVPVGATLGVILMILLLTGFLSHAFSPSRTRWED